MRYTVIETFATPRHRFVAGHGISDSWIDGPVSVARWVELGKIALAEDAAAPAMPPAEEPAADPGHADDPSSE